MVRSIRCRAHRRDGQACRRWAILGGRVCPSHGGSAPQVKAAATLRYAALLDPALNALAELLDGERTSDAVRLGAARVVLDAVGIGIGVASNRTANGAVGFASQDEHAKVESVVELEQLRHAPVEAGSQTSMGRDLHGSDRSVPESSESVPGEEPQ